MSWAWASGLIPTGSPTHSCMARSPGCSPIPACTTGLPVRRRPSSAGTASAEPRPLSSTPQAASQEGRAGGSRSARQGELEDHAAARGAAAFRGAAKGPVGTEGKLVRLGGVLRPNQRDGWSIIAVGTVEHHLPGTEGGGDLSMRKSFGPAVALAALAALVLGLGAGSASAQPASGNPPPPKGFEADSASFVSAQAGFVLGARHCSLLPCPALLA